MMKSIALSAIKRYLAQVSREALDANEARRWTEIIQFTINLEHIGDILSACCFTSRSERSSTSFVSVAGMNEIGDCTRGLPLTCNWPLRCS